MLLYMNEGSAVKSSSTLTPGGTKPRRARDAARRYKLDRSARPFVGRPTAEDLKTVRTVACLSITEIAEILRVEPRTASRMLAGKASLAAMQFCDVLRAAEHKAPAAVSWLNDNAGPQWWTRRLTIDRAGGQSRIGILPD